MIEVNLIPDVKQEFLKTRRQRNVVISFALIAGAVALGVVAILAAALGTQALRSKLATDEINSQYKQLKSVSDLSEIVTIQNQLTKLGDQNTSRTINSRLFDILSAVNPKSPNDVKFSNVTLDPETKTLTLEGTAANGYEGVETLKKTILNSKLDYTKEGKPQSVALTSNVSVGETSYGESSDGAKVLQFSISAVYADDLFSNAITNATISGPTGRTDVTDSKTHVPDSLFSAPANTDEEKS